MGNCLAKEETDAERRAKEIVEAASAPKPKSSAKPKSNKAGGGAGGGGGGAGGTYVFAECVVVTIVGLRFCYVNQ